MSAVEEILAAIDNLTELKAESAPVRHDSSWVVDYDMPNLESTRILVLDSHNGGYDGSTVAEVTSESRAQLIVTLHRTIDAQLAILEAAVFNIAASKFGHTHATVAAAIRLARAINGATK